MDPEPQAQTKNIDCNLISTSEIPSLIKDVSRLVYPLYRQDQ